MSKRVKLLVLGLSVLYYLTYLPPPCLSTPAPHEMTLTDQVVKSKLEDEFYSERVPMISWVVGQIEGDEQFIFILDQFKDRFADAGVKVVFVVSARLRIDRLAG